MRVVNGVVILSVFTICAWKCGQANATPGLWDSDKIEPVFDTGKYFSDDKTNCIFEVKSVFKKNTVELDNMAIAKDLNQGVAGWSTSQQVFHDVPGSNQQLNNNNMQREDYNRPINYVPENVFQNVDQSIVFHKDSKVFSSVPLEEVDSPDGQRKLAGVVKIPGGVSSVTIEQSPQGQKTSQVIEYDPIKQDGPVVITTNQDICANGHKSGVAGWLTSQQVFHDVPGSNQQLNNNNMQREDYNRPINYVPENVFQNVDQSIVFHKDSRVFSSVPLEEVDSRDGHRKLAGVVKIPGGVSSVTIERSPQGQKTSQVIEYDPIEQDGPVVISTNQDISANGHKSSDIC